MPELNPVSIDAACEMIRGTAKSMGLEVEEA
jgi:ribosomal protein L11